MKKLIYFFSVLFILMNFLNPITSAIETSTSNLSGLKTFPLSQLQDDFIQLKNIIMEIHPKLYADKVELNTLLSEQYKNLTANMNELEFYRILSPVISKLRCGHTRLQFSAEFESFTLRNGSYLPLRVKIIDNRAYVWRNLSNPEIPAGSEILTINQHPVSEIIRILLNNLTADGLNESKKYYEMNLRFSELYFTYVDVSEKFRISFIKPADKRHTEIILNAVPKSQLYFMMGLSDSIDQSTLLPYSQQITKDYGILKVQSFEFYDDGGRDRFKTFIDGFFRSLKKSQTKNLILDLRDNWGGDPYCSAYLYRNLITKPSVYFAPDSPYYGDLKKPLEPASYRFQGNLYVLINGASFSSTGHLCSLLKYHKIGIFVGQEAGGSYVCTDGSKDINLQNTRLLFHYSTMAFKTAVSGLTPGRGIMPDYPLIPTIEDYIANKDIEKEFTLDLIQKSKQAK